MSDPTALSHLEGGLCASYDLPGAGLGSPPLHGGLGTASLHRPARRSREGRYSSLYSHRIMRDIGNLPRLSLIQVLKPLSQGGGGRRGEGPKQYSLNTESQDG